VALSCNPTTSSLDFFLPLLTQVADDPTFYLKLDHTIFNGPIIPRKFTGTAYKDAWTSIEFPLHFWNSLWITSVTVIGVLVFATLSGYAFAKLDFPFRNTLFVLLLTTLMMPSTALTIPLYLELKSLGLLDSRAGLLVLYISGSAPFAMFLMRAFFQTLPDELIEAARVDGGSELTIFRRVILPLTRPGIATVGSSSSSPPGTSS